MSAPLAPCCLSTQSGAVAVARYRSMPSRREQSAPTDAPTRSRLTPLCPCSPWCISRRIPDALLPWRAAVESALPTLSASARKAITVTREAPPPHTTLPAAGTLVVEEPRFAIVPEWVIDAAVSDGAFRLYSLLLRYGNGSGSRLPDAVPANPGPTSTPLGRRRRPGDAPAHRSRHRPRRAPPQR